MPSFERETQSLSSSVVGICSGVGCIAMLVSAALAVVAGFHRQPLGMLLIAAMIVLSALCGYGVRSSTRGGRFGIAPSAAAALVVGIEVLIFLSFANGMSK